MDTLQSHRAAMLKEGFTSKEHAVFCNRVGSFISRTNFLAREHKPAIKRANEAETAATEKEKRTVDPVPTGLRFHDLRHSHASLLLSNGQSLKAVSARLGHAKVEVTLRHYAHCMTGEDAKLSDAIGSILHTS